MICSLSGHTYDMKCAHCCARMLIAARPGRRQHDAILASIQNIKGHPTIEQIQEWIRRIDSDRAAGLSARG